jgi:ABC-type uncharacterized transport system substrate-binding protein
MLDARRRQFITLLGRAAATWPLAASAQKAEKLRLIGFLGATNPSLQREWTAAFVGRLAEFGWVEGRTVAIEYRWADARKEQFPLYLEEFVRRKVDVIVTHPDETVLIAKRMTSTIPIIFPLTRDPVEMGVVPNLARPNGNATGLSIQRGDTVGKRVEMLREIVPTIREQVADIAPAFARFAQHVDALYVVAEPLAYVNRTTISDLALAAKLPTVYSVREYVDVGGLVSYGPNFADMFRRSANFVDKVLRGTKPSDLPVEQPTKFDLVINLKTAKTLGLEIPPTLLARADEVIE